MFKAGSFGSYLAGVWVGIVFTLSMTLKFWGHRWWQVIIALALGVIGGLIVADYKKMFGVFHRAGDGALAGAKRIKIWNKQKVMTVLRGIGTAIGFLLRTATVAAGLIFGLWLFGCVIFSFQSNEILLENFLAVFSFLAAMVYWIFVWFLPYKLIRTGKIKKRLDGYSLGDFSRTCFNMNFSKEIAQEKKEKSWFWEEWRLFIANLFFIPYLALIFLEAFAVVIIFCAGIASVIIVFSCLMLREIWKDNRLLVGASSIVLGSVLGLWLESILGGLLKPILGGLISGTVFFLIPCSFSCFKKLQKLKIDSVFSPFSNLCWKIIN